MPTVLLKLIGPMQSWGVVSRFDQRDTFREPSKSGVLGLVCAAMGIERSDFAKQAPLYTVRMGVRHDKPGILRYDFQTAACKKTDSIIRADGKHANDGGVISRRYYLADAAFLVGLESCDLTLLDAISYALNNPVWPIYMGRKSYVPSEPILCGTEPFNMPLEEALRHHPLLRSIRNSTAVNNILMSIETTTREGLFVMDQPQGALQERRFAARYLKTETIEIC